MEVIWLGWLVLVVAHYSSQLYHNHQLLIGYITVFIVWMHNFITIDSIYTERYMGVPDTNVNGYKVLEAPFNSSLCMY